MSGSTRSSTTTAEGSREAALRATAVAYAHAFLTGTVLDLLDLQSPACRTKEKAKPTPTPSQIAAGTKGLQKLRDGVSRMTGLSAAQVQSKISGVSVRDVGTSTGEAEVRYDLPVTATGNDNWVIYKLVDGEWKVHDCHLPVGGMSS